MNEDKPVEMAQPMAASMQVSFLQPQFMWQKQQCQGIGMAHSGVPPPTHLRSGRPRCLHQCAFPFDVVAVAAEPHLPWFQQCLHLAAAAHGFAFRCPHRHQGHLHPVPPSPAREASWTLHAIRDRCVVSACEVSTTCPSTRMHMGARS